MVDAEIINRENHIGFLDALRGFLAFWVYYGHLKMASIGRKRSVLGISCSRGGWIYDPVWIFNGIPLGPARKEIFYFLGSNERFLSPAFL
jgi:hypothetical protein